MNRLSVDLRGKAAVITGGGTGIGRAIAMGMGRCGASIVVNYSRSRDEAEATAAEIERSGGRAIAIRADVTKGTQVQSLFDSAVESFGKVHILVNNAGGNLRRGPLSEMDEPLWDQTIDLNLKSAFLCCKAAIRLLPDGEGRIINISSISAHTGGANAGVAYAAAKGGLISLTRGLAVELAPRGITVNAISPGIIDTGYHQRLTDPADYRASVARVPLQRAGKPDDLVGVALLLAAAEGGYITGQVIQVNGGLVMS